MRTRFGAFAAKYGCGDKVCRIDDERHVGRIDAILSGVVKVIWEDNGWIEYVTSCDELELVERAK